MLFACLCVIVIYVIIKYAIITDRLFNDYLKLSFLLLIWLNFFKLAALSFPPYATRLCCSLCVCSLYSYILSTSHVQRDDPEWVCGTLLTRGHLITCNELPLFVIFLPCLIVVFSKFVLLLQKTKSYFTSVFDLIIIRCYYLCLGGKLARTGVAVLNILHKWHQVCRCKSKAWTSLDLCLWKGTREVGLLLSPPS